MVVQRFALSLLAVATFVAALLLGPGYMLASQQVALDTDWRQADRRASGLAPDPATLTDAVVQVYAARTFGWRGAFGVHTWIATKAEGAERYRIHQVLSWRRPVVVSAYGSPDRYWYGNPPTLLADIRGARASRAIDEIETAVANYPRADRYRVWPGPNSNTFVAWVVRSVSALSVDFPPTAIGKDYLIASEGDALSGVLASAPSGTGYQVSLNGLLGVMLAFDEGIEWNVLGLAFGVDWRSPALKLPGLGRIGMAQPSGARSVDQQAALTPEGE
ncbi:DUF3750 domain-containing protein [Salinicola halophilus]|uniref:DUF3750 domain-containing protein n=1 Tax=Salinicola halophilus TaxID=184065 RepID=UPI000DA19B20|nr:DUF3750 domain-containing protein [Salinicola halophilus]